MKARFFYLAPLDFDTVFRTQVIGWVNIFREQGLDCTIVKLNPARKISFGRNRSDRKGIRELYDGQLLFLLTLPDKFILTRWYNALVILMVISPALLSGLIAVIQIRSSALNASLKTVKKIAGKKVQIIYDSRAAAAEEYLYSAPQVTGNLRKTYEGMREADKRMVSLSDRVFCVSSVLADYHMTLSGGMADKQKFFLYPGNADERFFFYSEEIRRSVRRELGLEEKFVIVYSGGLEMPWHVPDMLFSFFARLSNLADDAFFLVLSGDSRIAMDYAARLGVDSGRIRILSADNRQVHRYLNAADLGTLFRKDDIMNRVSSPTKFAEYIMCGLPVAISPSVGDLSAVIDNTGWGLIYDETIEETSETLDRKRKLWSAGRSDIAGYGYKNFSKQSAINRIIKVYDELASPGLT